MATVTEIYDTLLTKINKVMEEPPQYEEVTLPDGFCCQTFVKPQFSLLSLGYDRTKHTKDENMKVLQEVTNKINENLKNPDDSDQEGMMYVSIIIKNNDYVFMLNLP